MSTNEQPVRWGIIGTARINGKLLAGARTASGVDDPWPSPSRDAAKAQAYAAEVGAARAHGSYEALLADPEVDAVYISLPNHLHHPWTMKALAAGKHVLCEKPYSRRPADVEEAWDAADAAGLVLQEAFMWRHSPQTARLLELLPRIGPLSLIRATFAFPLPDPANVRLGADLDGGSLMDVGCYTVSGVAADRRRGARSGPRRAAGGPDGRGHPVQRSAPLPARHHRAHRVRLHDGAPGPGGHRGRRVDRGAGPLARARGHHPACGGAAGGGDRQRALQRTPTGPSWRTWRPPSGATTGRSWVATMRSVRHARIEALYRRADTGQAVVLG